MVERSSESPIRALPQRRLGRMKLNELIRHAVGSADGRGPRVVVVELPRNECSILPRAGLDFNNPRRTEVRPCEFLLASPHHLHRFARSFGKPRSFNRRFAGMLAAI